MSETPWLKFYPTDWRADPALRMCSLAARGLWIEMLALMHEATPYGYLLVSGRSPTDAQLAVLVGAPSEQIPGLLGELEAAGVFSRTKEGAIYSRKMTRTAKKAAVARKNGKMGGNPTLCNTKENPASVNLMDKGEVKTQKPEARSQIEKEEPDGSSKKPRDPPEKHRRAVSLPEGWVPSDKNILDAKSRNFTDEEIRHEAERFRDYHLAKGTTFKDWDAGWRTWLGNARSFGQASRSQANNPGRGGSSIASIVARRRLADRG